MFVAMALAGVILMWVGAGETGHIFLVMGIIYTFIVTLMWLLVAR